MYSAKELSRFLVSCCLVLLISACSKPPEKLLVGVWKGVDVDGRAASLVFNEDGTAAMVQGSTVLDGASIGGQVLWKLDDAQNPMHLDVVVSSASGEKRYLRMILRFITDNKIQSRMSEGGTARPAIFSPTDDAYQIVLDRQ